MNIFNELLLQLLLTLRTQRSLSRYGARRDRKSQQDTYPSRAFNFKLGCFAAVKVLPWPRLELKTQTGFGPAG